VVHSDIVSVHRNSMVTIRPDQHAALPEVGSAAISSG